ncbi:MAG: Rpn family recombination-promoting nuclease/putative transposase [Leptospiraceae bacterium]|nr:Rpn family recombination-promoting nuclease/putative transposase [Leptospiraceae bacterium]MCP5502784.1 Rpn family recombination-promoting nuclease/putative transposase [Leptospiraceae bacterium]
MNNKDLLIRFDWVIKTMLRDKANFDIIEGFLSALLKEEITVLEILESESNQQNASQKYNRVDVLIRDSKDRKLIIEVQSDSESDFLERLLFGTSKTIVDHFRLGESYSNISKIISVSVQYFNMGRGTDYIYYGSTEIRGMHTNELLDVREKVETMIDGELRIKFQKKNIFPEYYIISVNRYPDIVREDIDEWIYMMKNNIVKTEFHSRNIDRAREKLKILNMSEQERLDYEKYLMNSAIEKDVISTARIEGRAEGKAEEKQETTINCIEAGLSNETIQQITGLSLEEIQMIREGLGS